MQLSYLVVDDFLDNPDELRAAALKLDYAELQGAFPGRNSWQRINVDGMTEQVSRLVNERLEPISPLASHAKCRITLAHDEGFANVHIDHSYWSGILYLSRPEDCRGGTDFFRHIETGTDQAPLSRDQLAAMGYASFDDMFDNLIKRDTNDPDKWEHLMRVPMRYNRLVLLRPWLWHTAGPGFGDSLDNGRLVYLMFYKPVGAP